MTKRKYEAVEAPTPKEEKEMYLVNSMKQTLTVVAMGIERDLPLKGVAEGCIGVSLWFDTLEHAKAWGGDDAEITVGKYKKKEK